MTVFAVSRRGDPAGPLLLVSADDAEEAALIAEQQEDIGAFFERGYKDAPVGYTAVEADEHQKKLWIALIKAGIAERVINPDHDDPDWLTFLRPPEFEPPIDDDDAEDSELEN